MLTWFIQIIAPPIFENEDQARKAKLLNAMELILLAVLIVLLPILIILAPQEAQTNLLILAPTVGFILVLLYLLRRGNVEISGILLVAMLWFIITVTSWLYGGLRNSTISSYFIIVAIASLLWGGRATLAWGSACILTTLGLFAAEVMGLIRPPIGYPPTDFFDNWFLPAVVFGIVTSLLAVGASTLHQALHRTRQNEQVLAQRTAELAQTNASLEAEMVHRQQAQEETERLQQQVIEAQRETLKELSTPIIPVMDAPDGTGGIIVMPLIGSIDTFRARDITRALLAGISEHRARTVIVDITGVAVVDTEVANYLNKTIQAARLKGAQVIITGISDAVAETIVDLEIDWSEMNTLSDLQSGLVVALSSLGLNIKEKNEQIQLMS